LQAHADSPASTTNLGREENNFFGREDEQRALTELMQTRSGFITVLGPPGTGKTRLTKHWATDHLSSGAVTSAWFCDLTEARSEEGVIQAVASDLGVSLTTTKDGVAALAELVGKAIKDLGVTLIVIDNAEQVVEWVGTLVERWWKHATEACFVVTSQVPTGVAMEQRMPLAPLPMPSPEDSDTPCPAVQLFVDRAQSVKPSFEQTPDNQADIAAIVRSLDGLPLAIELAAARMHLMTPATLHARLADRFRLLKRPKQAGPARHQALQAALDWSWDLLEPWEQAALAQCSVFHGGFDWEAVEAVVVLSAWPEAPWSVDVVAELVERSLVMAQEDKGGIARLTLLTSVAEYARARRAELSEAATQAAGLRHARHYAKLGSQDYLSSLSTTGSVARRWRQHGELENLVVGVDVALDSADVETAARCALGATSVLAQHGPFLRAEAILKRIAGQPMCASTQGQVLYYLGWMLRLNGQISASKVATEEAAEISHQCGDTYCEILALSSLAMLLREQGATSGALQHLESALSIAQTNGHRMPQGSILGRLALLTAEGGEIPAALEYYHQALALARETGNRGEEGICTGNMTMLYFDLGEIKLALTHSQEALRISNEVGNQRGLGINLGHLARIHQHLGDTDKALALYSEALTIMRQTGELRTEGVTLGNLGLLMYSQGKLDSAEEHFNKAISICDMVIPPAAGHFRARLALLRSDQGELSEARALLDTAEQLIQQTHWAALAEVCCICARVEFLAGDTDTAIAYLSKAEAIVAKTGTKPDSVLGKAIDQVRTLIGG
jgi:predicted ATPase/Tfp pilus assembly protein PilF